MSEINYLETSNTTAIRRRFSEARAKLKHLRAWKIKDFSAAVIDEHPEFDNINGAQVITDAWNGRKPNLFLMEFIEELVESIEKQ